MIEGTWRIAMTPITNDPTGPFPGRTRVTHSAGNKAATVGPEIDRLAVGVYSAKREQAKVTLVATDVAMSGVHCHAAFVRLPNYIDPPFFELHAYEHDPAVMNQVRGTAHVEIPSGEFTEIRVTDANGVQTVKVA